MLKDSLLKLQSYTMDVNKMLLDERVLPTENAGFFMENTETKDIDLNNEIIIGDFE